jgi:ATP-dependent DNA helicase RecQ
MRIYTIGYGARPIGDFLALLRAHRVAVLVDARSLPQSRFRPDYRQKALQAHLESAEIDYWYLGKALGGRVVDPAALVGGRVDLEKLATLPDFRAALDAAAARAAELDAHGAYMALMCAEQRPENCHRAWMLAPQMEARGFEVLHIDERGMLKTQAEVQSGVDNAQFL